MAPTFLLLLLLWPQGPVAGERVGGWLPGEGVLCSWTPFLLFRAQGSCGVGVGRGGGGRADLVAPYQRPVRRFPPSIWPRAKLTQASQTKIKLWTLSAWAPLSACLPQDL